MSKKLHTLEVELELLNRYKEQTERSITECERRIEVEKQRIAASETAVPGDLVTKILNGE